MMVAVFSHYKTAADNNDKPTVGLLVYR